ncbi:MAG: N-acetyl-alpha-D-glucosaminyl L-malate synthase BshA [Flavobacteriales bacterium]|nr:N-acetyl-alpha-D-glucosaminyl L-malate synthase BshA [Flavobacteriales bacterium]
MKIGIVLYPTYGGSGIVATELGKELANIGHKVHFITYSQPVKLGAFHHNIFYHEVRVSDYPLFAYTPYELVLTSKLVNVVKYEKLDVLHVHYAIPHASSAYMAKQILASQGIHIPFITTLHGTDITLVGKDASFEPVINFAINNSDAVTAVSQSLKNDTLKYFDVTRDIHVIPNFVRMENYVGKPIKHIRSDYAPNGERIITHISNFRKVKRIPDIIRAFKKILEHEPAILLLIGDGPERNNVEQLCRDLDVCSKIHFLGSIKHPQSVLQSTDLFMLPSETESFGLAALEAMASSVPVIASNTGGVPEVIQDGYGGHLHEVGDTDAMAKLALTVFADLERYKTEALENAKGFDISQILPQYIKLYDSLLPE